MTILVLLNFIDCIWVIIFGVFSSKLGSYSIISFVDVFEEIFDCSGLVAPLNVYMCFVLQQKFHVIRNNMAIVQVNTIFFKTCSGVSLSVY